MSGRKTSRLTQASCSTRAERAHSSVILKVSLSKCSIELAQLIEFWSPPRPWGGICVTISSAPTSAQRLDEAGAPPGGGAGLAQLAALRS